MSRGIAPLILTSALQGGEWSASRPGHLVPEKALEAPREWEVKWDPWPVCTIWRSEESLDRAAKLNHDSSVFQTATYKLH